MFYLYIIKSVDSGTYYVGISSDIKERLEKHNKGMVKSTKSKKPWVLVYSESFASRGAATKRELQLKSWKKRSALEKLMQYF